MNNAIPALSEQDRAVLSQKAKRYAAILALRLAVRPYQAYDLYLAGLNALPRILERYKPGDTMGFFHAIELPLRNAVVRASVELMGAPEPPLPDTLSRLITTGHLL